MALQCILSVLFGIAGGRASHIWLYTKSCTFAWHIVGVQRSLLDWTLQFDLPLRRVRDIGRSASLIYLHILPTDIDDRLFASLAILVSSFSMASLDRSGTNCESFLLCASIGLRPNCCGLHLLHCVFVSFY
eukprot:4420183-Pleurochrysis_carterae.AAC.1